MQKWKRRSLATALGASLVLAPMAFIAPAAHAAITPTSTDRDGDGLPDAWETNGVDTNGDGVIDLDLPALGADPDRADLFVELDWMPGLLPSTAELDTIRTTFAGMPVNNPDGSTGIRIHLDAGSARGSAYNLGGGNEIPYTNNLSGVTEVTSIRALHSDVARANVFHYAVFGDTYGSGSSSGEAYINGLDLLVTLGPTYWGDVDSSLRVGTFIHELGHNLGLLHGGNDNVNFKPGYLSIMNYSYQLTGVPRTGASPSFSYSRVTTPTLNESALVETAGLGAAAAGYDVYWWVNGTKYRSAAGAGIDWNANGSLSSASFALDLNQSYDTSTLSGPNDFSLLRLAVGSKGSNASGISKRSAPQVASNELDVHTAEELHPELFAH